MAAEETTKTQQTEVGSVFISNYPPFSGWHERAVDPLRDVFATPPAHEHPLGLYVHIPFCRKRCKFCYFKVYTDKNSKQIQRYVDALITEMGRISQVPAVQGRKPKFLYIGGGTPSYISAKHLRRLFEGLRENWSFEAMEEVTFECEPGTLTEAKLDAIREVGVTRLSLGVENFDDAILSENGRAHLSGEIYRVLPWIKARGFDQLNIDLIAGMVGETEDNWQQNIEKAIEVDPDSITIYQMELPYNTVYSKGLLQGAEGEVFADWQTKRAWHSEAIDRLQDAGYAISSAYTMVKKNSPSRFVYRDALWHGADLLPLGCSSFGHLGGIHYQNHPSIERYIEAVEAAELPVRRAYQTSERDRLIRETILQLKLGELDPKGLNEKFGVNLLETFDEALTHWQAADMLKVTDGRITLTRRGLLQVDSLLPEFYDAQWRTARYT
ncbi:coproporphyrinogen-III oxidase family protein [Acanthopleuribacter pedis]|uniref:Coproporphyrinogen III oxidase family protein n=1 Tax=Acanthopleuribacter pedis TaxID=442870 RepID=A0A8J7U100_9BACT|nr:coproporphyrinogen-III oxidase family protein [Acanthopleuribacter pedis]MBO1317628.1 coproporphyrinogen III oxidase family protein [Acanthopleuribacter pedis]